MADGKYDDTRAFNGRKVALWALFLFFLISIGGTLGTYLFGKWLTPVLDKREKEEIQKAEIQRIRDREEAKGVR